MRRLTALCEDPNGAQSAIAALLEGGIAERDISILLIDHGQVLETDLEHKTLVPHGAVLGTATGAAVGLGLVAIGGIPGLFAAGPVLAILQGVSGGAAAGFLLGALSGLAWWKSEAEIPRELLETDGVLVGIPISDERVQQMTEALREAGIQRIHVN